MCGRGEGRGSRRGRSKDVWDVEGGYMGMKKQKLAEQFTKLAKDEDQGSLFSGIAIFVNGWTVPGADELKRIMMTHGGVFNHYYNSRKTTHIIASNLPDVKVRQLKGHEIIVKPEWITDCVAQNKLLDYKKYLLYTNQSRNQPRIKFSPQKESEEQLTAHEGDKPKDKYEDNEDTGEECTESKECTEMKTAEKDSPSKWMAKDASDTRFMGEFFSNSRLHHISTMGANAKDYVSQLRSSSDGTFSDRRNLDYLKDTATGKIEKTVMHIDMDCFFVSVGLRNRPELVGLPVVVAHARGNRPSRGELEDQLVADRRKREITQYQQRRGEDVSSDWKLGGIDGTSSMSEIASCSYEARAKGVRNGMFLGPALQLCPDLQSIPYDFVGYEEVSQVLYDSLASYTLEIQAVSCDEMFVDLTSLCQTLNMDPMKFVTHLRSEIRKKTKGCPCSVGLGPNILLARMATKTAKPDGQHQVSSEQEALASLSVLEVKELPGVGRSMVTKLGVLGVITVGDLIKLPLGRLQQELGSKTGLHLYNMARGKDDRKLEVDHVRKTVGAEVNYGIRFQGWHDTDRFLEQLAQEVSSRLQKVKMRGKTITLKLMMRAADAPEETSKFNGHGVCDNLSKSNQLNSITDSWEIIFKEVSALIRSLEVNPKDMRGLGISISKLELHMKKDDSNSILKFMKKDFNKTIETGKDLNETKIPDAEIKNTGLHEDNSNHVDVDEEFLAALPPNIRAEVQLQMKSLKCPSRVSKEGNLAGPSLSQSDQATKDEHHVRREDLDPTFLDQLPPDIRAEFESNMLERPKIGLVSKMIENETSPESDFLIEDKVKSNQNVKVCGNIGEEIAGPSLINIKFNPKSPNLTVGNSAEEIIHDGHGSTEYDKSFLEQLPPDIRAELEADIDKHKRRTNESIEDNKDELSNDGDISFSQIDPGVLSELPFEVQLEVRKQFSRNTVSKNTKVNNQLRTAFDALMTSRSSPKKKSPVKAGKGKGRGRKKGALNVPKKSPLKNSVSSTKSRINTISSISSDSKVDIDVLNSLPSDLRAEIEAEINQSNTRNNLNIEYTLDQDTKSSLSVSEYTVDTQPCVDDTETKPGQAKEQLKKGSGKANEPPSFCGKKTITEIRPLLKEWLKCSPVPQEEDVSMLANFLKDLIIAWNIELVQIILKCLMRNIKNLCSNTNLWQNAYVKLVQQVQLVMIQSYGSPLAICDSF